MATSSDAAPAAPVNPGLRTRANARARATMNPRGRCRAIIDVLLHPKRESDCQGAGGGHTYLTGNTLAGYGLLSKSSPSLAGAGPQISPASRIGGADGRK